MMMMMIAGVLSEQDGAKDICVCADPKIDGRFACDGGGGGYTW